MPSPPPLRLLLSRARQAGKHAPVGRGRERRAAPRRRPRKPQRTCVGPLGLSRESVVAGCPARRKVMVRALLLVAILRPLTGFSVSLLLGGKGRKGWRSGRA